MPMTYVSVPRKRAGEIVKRDIVEVSEEMADREIARWEANAKNPKSKSNPNGSAPGNIHWKLVKYATEEDLIAAGIMKAEVEKPEEKKTKKQLAEEAKLKASQNESAE